MRLLFLVTIGLFSLAPLALSHQPVMDMAPRWDEGWGFQVRHESRYADKTKSGDSKTDNPLGRKRSVNKTWIEGVYTWNRSIRATLKLPYVEQSRTAVVDGVPIKQTGEGFGDLILGLPLKHYINRAGATENIGFTPSLRVPTGTTHGEYPASDGGVDAGLSVSYSSETPVLYQFYDAFYWFNDSQKSTIDEGDLLGFDANIGIHPYHDNATNSGIFVMGDLRVRYQERGRDPGGDTGGTRISVGPVVVYYYQNIMFRAEYRFPVYENVAGSQVSYGQELAIGIGITF